MSDTKINLPIGFIGLGAMGSGMAQSLLRAGLYIKGYDVNPEAVQRFVAAGGEGATSAAEAATGVRALLFMVLNAEQIDDALFGTGAAAAQLASGSLVLVCSTVKPSYVRNLGRRLAGMGIDLLDAPVSGGTARAAEGRLSVMASGSPSAFERSADILAALAENVYRMGDEPGQGSTMKLVNQALAGIHIAAAAEALALGARAGLDPHRIFEVISHSAGASWMFQNRVPHILDEDFTPRSAVEIWVKDLGIVLETGKEVNLPVPLSATAYQLFLMAVSSGFARLDDAAVIKVYEKLADFRVMDSSSE
jgi:3-hydroxyisobutyrate dehydrogenase